MPIYKGNHVPLLLYDDEPDLRLSDNPGLWVVVRSMSLAGPTLAQPVVFLSSACLG